MTTSENHINFMEASDNKQHFSISVRALVEYLLHSGDLSGAFISPGRSLAGIRAHQRVQKSRPESYEPEVPVSHIFESGDYVIEVSGRIDGIFRLPDHDVLEEIKTTSRELAAVEKAQNPHHWAQLKIYAYMHAVKYHLETVQTCLTYVQFASNAVREIRREFEFDTLELFFEELISRFVGRADGRRKWRAERNRSIDDLEFPHAQYRKGQREMAVQIFRAVREKQQLLVQAPTGIGKTVAAIFPAVKAVGEGLVSRIFYLAARSTGKTVAEGTLAALQRKGLRFKCLTLTAKEKICFNPGAGCNGDECEFARGYYDRIDVALDRSLRCDLLDRHLIETTAWQHRVCPFEMSLDLSLHADCIVSDYNYAFDPQAYLRRFFQVVEEDYLFIVDEAHNLVDRSRDMYSAKISRQPVREACTVLKEGLPQLCRFLEKIDAWMAACGSGRKEALFATAELPQDLISLLRLYVEESESWLSANTKIPFRETVLDLHFTFSRFIKVAELFDARYAVCYDFSNGDIGVNLFCMDPSSHLQQRLENIRSTVFFSATLTPMDYFKHIFGCGSSAQELILPSPFPGENFSLTIANDISTYFNQREQTKGRIAETITSFVRHRQGNYFIFFPSYSYLEKVHFEVVKKMGDVDMICQHPGMSEHERDDFIKRFSRENTRTLVGFAVLGGVFGEGIDLVGDRLAGAVIVSVGMPPPTPERELIREYFQESRNAGWSFAYIFPGFNRVLQAAGRVIRTEIDRGAVLLIDTRFGSECYRSMFPPDWEPVYIGKEDSLSQTLRKFWQRT